MGVSAPAGRCGHRPGMVKAPTPRAKTRLLGPAQTGLANYLCILKRAHQRGRGLGLKPGSDVFQVRKQRTPFHSTIPP